MRTDGVQVTPEALTETRRFIGSATEPSTSPRARDLQDEGQERPGGARGDPPDLARPRSVQARLEPDLNGSTS
jgi:hypothetical protein